MFHTICPVPLYHPQPPTAQQNQSSRGMRSACQRFRSKESKESEQSRETVFSTSMQSFHAAGKSSLLWICFRFCICVVFAFICVVCMLIRLCRHRIVHMLSPICAAHPNTSQPPTPHNGTPRSPPASRNLLHLLILILILPRNDHRRPRNTRTIILPEQIIILIIIVLVQINDFRRFRGWDRRCSYWWGIYLCGFSGFW